MVTVATLATSRSTRDMVTKEDLEMAVVSYLYVYVNSLCGRHGALLCVSSVTSSPVLGGLDQLRL